MRVTGLIPTRFLTLTSHLVLLITVLLARYELLFSRLHNQIKRLQLAYNWMQMEENVLACLPVDHTEVEYKRRDGEFLGGLIAGIALIALEFIGFISGVSMFTGLTSLISIACHCGASISLAYMVLDSWDCRLYWWVFALTSFFPAMTEIGVMINVLMFKKNV